MLLIEMFMASYLEGMSHLTKITTHAFLIHNVCHCSRSLDRHEAWQVINVSKH